MELSMNKWKPLKEVEHIVAYEHDRYYVTYADGTIRNISFLQYLYENEIGRELMSHEVVSQIDNDLTNYKLENLRLYVRHPDWPNILDEPVPASKRQIRRAYPYFSKRDGRYYMNIHYYDLKRLGMSRARYNMEQYLGRDLLPSEDTDHIDNDKTNDDISNLQILSHTKNVEKAALERGYRVGDAMYGQYTCGVCDTLFTRLRNKADKKEVVYCGRSCSSKANQAKQYPGFDEPVTLTCKFCKKLFTRNKAAYNKSIAAGTAAFKCGNDCTGLVKPEKARRKTITLGAYSCDCCNKPVVRDVSRVETKKKRGFKHIYCDAKCAAIHRHTLK